MRTVSAQCLANSCRRVTSAATARQCPPMTTSRAEALTTTRCLTHWSIQLRISVRKASVFRRRWSLPVKRREVVTAFARVVVTAALRRRRCRSTHCLPATSSPTPLRRRSSSRGTGGARRRRCSPRCWRRSTGTPAGSPATRSRRSPAQVRGRRADEGSAAPRSSGRPCGAGLIDEYTTVTHPVLVGGTPFVTALNSWVNLSLVETRTFPAGGPDHVRDEGLTARAPRGQGSDKGSESTPGSRTAERGTAFDPRTSSCRRLGRTAKPRIRRSRTTARSGTSRSTVGRTTAARCTPASEFRSGPQHGAQGLALSAIRSARAQRRGRPDEQPRVRMLR